MSGVVEETIHESEVLGLNPAIRVARSENMRDLLLWQVGN